MIVLDFLRRLRGCTRFDVTDVITYTYLVLGAFIMFGPVVWLVMSSFKDKSLLITPNPTLLPYRQQTLELEGYPNPLPLYNVTLTDLYVGEAQVIQINIPASNGFLHGLDRLILTEEQEQALSGLGSAAALTVAEASPPPNEEADLAATVASLADYSILAALIQAAEFDLSAEELTLLAPTNAAFEGWSAETLGALAAQPELLGQILQNHVLPDDLQVVRLYRGALDGVENQAGILLDIRLEPQDLTRRLAQVGSPRGAQYNMIDPDNVEAGEFPVFIYATPEGPSTILAPIEEVYFQYRNYTEGLQAFNFRVYLWNTVIVTFAATVITLLINSMAAFALSKYQFAGRDATFVIIISTLMVPVSVILIPAFLVISQVGWRNNLWGLIIPGAATPTGVFLLRQYMLTIPDELLDSARIDGASEWRIYWQIILPLARPALAVLAIFSVMWRWNDFLWPLIVVSRNDKFTLQVGLNAFQGALDIQWHYILAMTVLTLLPITLVFAFLQRFITSGIATTGLKG